MGNRGQVRTVRLDEHAIAGEAPGDSAQLVGIPEREHTGEGHVEAELDGDVREALASREAVKHAPDLFRVGLSEDSNGVVLRVPSVNDDGTPELSRERKLSNEGFLLLRSRRVIVVVVEPSLTDSDDLRMVRKLAKPLQAGIVHEPRIVRMNTDRRIEARVALRDLEGTFVALHAMTGTD